MTFLIAEGVTPSNEGRGYILRRLIRRSVTQARRIGLDDVYRLPAIVVEQVGPWYPDVSSTRARSSASSAPRRSASARRSSAG